MAICSKEDLRAAAVKLENDDEACRRVAEWLRREADTREKNDAVRALAKTNGVTVVKAHKIAAREARRA